MLRKQIVIIAIAVALLVFFTGCNALQAKTSYQGQLTDASGAPVPDGDYQMTYRLYDSDDAAVGDALWNETQTVPVSDGLFNVNLGATQPITTALFAQQLWLGVEVEGDGEMTPRQELTGAPYAMSLVAGAGVQGLVNRDDPLPSSFNVANIGSGYGIGVNAAGAAGIAVDGGFSGTPTGQSGLLVDNFLYGAVITSTNGTGVWVKGNGGVVNDDYGVRAESEEGDGVFGWGHGTGTSDTGVSGRGDDGYGVYGFASSNPWGLYTPDDLFVGGSCTGCALRYVSLNASEALLRPGDMVTAVGVEPLAGMATPVMEVARVTAGEHVLGVVVGRTEIFMVEAGRDDVQAGIHFGEVGGEAAPGDYLIIVVEGPAQVRASDVHIGAGDRVYLGAAGVSREGSGPELGMALDGVDAEGLVWVLVGFE